MRILYRGALFTIMVLIMPGECKTSMVFGELLQDHKIETLTSSITRIGGHIQKKYGLNVGTLNLIVRNS